MNERRERARPANPRRKSREERAKEPMRITIRVIPGARTPEQDAALARFWRRLLSEQDL